MSSERVNSNLDDSVLAFIDKSVCTQPVYGWGWAEGYEEKQEFSPAEVPNPFSFRIAEFFEWNGERRGGIGQILEANHIYDGFWFLFYTRHIGCFDFVHRIGNYNFHIGSRRPSLYPPSHDPMMAERWPLPRFADCPSIVGYGRIGVSREVMENFEGENEV
jgi:hypothetical protein